MSLPMGVSWALGFFPTQTIVRFYGRDRGQDGAALPRAGGCTCGCASTAWMMPPLGFTCSLLNPLRTFCFHKRMALVRCSCCVTEHAAVPLSCCPVISLRSCSSCDAPAPWLSALILSAFHHVSFQAKDSFWSIWPHLAQNTL